MMFQHIISQYFEELRNEISISVTIGESTHELSHRVSLDIFFRNVTEEIDKEIGRIHEPKNQEKIGRPDWRFHDSVTMGVYGYVEAKGLDPHNTINIKDYQKQVDKYLVLGNPVILTDGVDFVLFMPNGENTLYSLCKKPINWEKPELDFEIEILFRIFFKKIGYRKISENQLVSEVAKRAKCLSEELVELLRLDEDEAESVAERNTIRLLRELKNIAGQSHDKSLMDNKTFAGFIAQILTFGLLYAHRVVDRSSENPKDKYRKIHDFWFSVMEENYSNKLIPFKTLVRELKSELDSDLSKLGIWYDNTRRLLSYIQLTTEQIEFPDYHELYEIFLSEFDPKTRFDYGAFYTPRSLAFYMVDLLKSIINKSLPNLDIESVRQKVIDPCCGTGTFIEAMLEKFHFHPTSRIIGFEILPAPYALAHYRMTMLREQYPDNIKIILTNTLSDNLFEETQIAEDIAEIESLLLREQQIAYQLATPPLTIIIGNPPSSDSKFHVANEGEIIRSLMEDFRPDKRNSRQNTQKQLANEFVKFLRWSIERALKNTPSVFALILPSSFAKHPSYKYARKYIYDNVSELWILEFDTDNRTGADASNIFNTLQGRLILVGVLKSEINKITDAFYKNICNLNKYEKQLFFETKVSLNNWISIKLDNNFSFKPINDYDIDTYKCFWPLTGENGNGVFLRHCSGLKLSPTHLLVHLSKGQLKRRTKFISLRTNNYSTIKERWYSGQQKPPPSSKINDKIRDLLGAAISKEQIARYSYRPFLEASVVLDEKLLDELGNMPGGGMRDRPEVRAAYQNSDVFGFVVAPAPEDLGRKLHKFSSFCRYIPDNDLSKRGNAHVFCNLFPEYKKKRSWNPKVKNNINPELLKGLSNLFNIKEAEFVNLITFYCYALLSSDYYLLKFEGKLHNVAGEWPGIPITADKKLFLSLSKLGMQLGELESSDYAIDINNENLEEIEYHKYKIEINSICFMDASGLLIRTINNIDEAILDFEISGYNIIREWLKLHSYPYYRKKLDQSDIKDLFVLFDKISMYKKVISKIDCIVEKIIERKLLQPYCINE